MSDIDRLIHEPARLVLVSNLYVVDEADFVYLANRTGLSVSLISQIELGKSAASMSTMHKLATALQVRMTYFFETL